MLEPPTRTLTRSLDYSKEGLAVNATRDSYFGRMDQMVRRALASHPDWLAEKILPYLDGWPNPGVCWVWTRSLVGGYGQINIPRAVYTGAARVHRVMWILLRGDIEEGMVIDHDGPEGCRNRACANPAHLKAVTQRHNTVVTGSGIAAINAAKTHCKRGHPLSGENLIVTIRNGNELRECRICHSMTPAERALWPMGGELYRFTSANSHSLAPEDAPAPAEPTEPILRPTDQRAMGGWVSPGVILGDQDGVEFLRPAGEPPAADDCGGCCR